MNKKGLKDKLLDSLGRNWTEEDDEVLSKIFRKNLKRPIPESWVDDRIIRSSYNNISKEAEKVFNKSREDIIEKYKELGLITDD
jgi:hypothetical protein